MWPPGRPLPRGRQDDGKTVCQVVQGAADFGDNGDNVMDVMRNLYVLGAGKAKLEMIKGLFRMQ